MNDEMHVIKRNGQREPVNFAKITSRIRKMSYGLTVDVTLVARTVCAGVYSGVHSAELDTLAAETAASLTSRHPDYSRLAARLGMSNLHHTVQKSFSRTMSKLHGYVHPQTGRPCPLVSDHFIKNVRKNAATLDAAIIHDNDLENYDFFGFKTLERSYLLKMDGKPAERIQHALMRCAVGIHGDDVEAAIETYKLMSEKWFTHASPTLFNSGTPQAQLSSCFLCGVEDSIDGIFNMVHKCALISKSAGGIGMHVHDIRATGSYIGGTNGVSNGLVPMLKVFNDTARYVDQGGGKRRGAIAVYLEPWHADVFEFLDLRKNVGADELRCRDLFLALWVPDLFMQRVQEDGTWCLFCPAEAPGLSNVHGQAFNDLYLKYESTEGLARKVIPAQKLWQAIVDAQIETGTPYVLFKDAVNAKSNQQNLGTIKSSNLCVEICQYTSPEEIAVCNLASIALPRFVTDAGTFDHQQLFKIAQVVCRNLNKVIDVTYYPVPEARNSNMRHRPIGIGVQGLADVFCLMRMPYDSEEARQLNSDIFETIYFGALTASADLAEQLGPYETFAGSPASQGKLNFDMWGVQPSDRWDWGALRKRVQTTGMRNSLLLAPMPTASTSQMLGFNECFEPYTSNIYSRRVLSGEFVCINQHLVRDLVALGLWDENMRNRVIAAQGSVQDIEEIPPKMRAIYKTVWEIKQRVLVDMAADRGAFIDQSQSMNLFLREPSYGLVTSMLFHAWKRGCKTGIYYLRARPAANAIQFTVDQEALKKKRKLEEQNDPSKSPPLKPAAACSMQEGCLMCGS